MREEKWTIWCGYIWRDNSCIYMFMDMIFWIMFHILASENRPAFQWNVDIYCGISPLYLLQLCIWIICFLLTTMVAKKDHGCHQKDGFCLFYCVQIHILKICTSWTKIQVCHITQLVWRTWIIFYYSRMWRIFTHFEDRRML